MGEYRTKTIIDISAEAFQLKLDEFTSTLDGKIIDIKLHTAPESKIEFKDEKGNQGQIYYNHYEAVVIYKLNKHRDTTVLMDKYKKFKKKIKLRNKSKKLDKILA